MVTEAGKELLRNTINTAKFHNRILEENEMWKQFDLERGLTMMVSDDIIKQKRKHHQCSKHRKQDRTDEREKNLNKKFKDKDPSVIRPSTSKRVTDRWDHSGFEELYPDGGRSEKDTVCSTGSNSNSNRWDHSGFEELYRDHSKSERGVGSSASSSSSSRKWIQSGLDCPNDIKSQKSSESSASSSSSSRKRKKLKKKKHKKKRDLDNYSNNSDNEIWEEFKSYKRKKKSDVHNISVSPDLKESHRNARDAHIKLWKKHKSKKI